MLKGIYTTSLFHSGGYLLPLLSTTAPRLGFEPRTVTLTGYRTAVVLPRNDPTCVGLKTGVNNLTLIYAYSGHRTLYLQSYTIPFSNHFQRTALPVLPCSPSRICLIIAHPRTALSSASPLASHPFVVAQRLSRSPTSQIMRGYSPA